MSKSKPIGAKVTFEWVNTKEQVTSYFSFGYYDAEKNVDSFGVDDDSIFYYAEGVEELERLMTTPEDFKVISWELVNG